MLSFIPSHNLVLCRQHSHGRMLPQYFPARQAERTMKATRLLIVLLITIAITGAIDEYLKASEVAESFWYTLGSTFLIGLLVFAWYYVDSQARAYQRSRWMNVAVVAVAVLAIPVYVAKSRDKGRKIRALVKLAGFGVLCVLADVLGGYAGGFIA